MDDNTVICRDNSALNSDIGSIMQEKQQTQSDADAGGAAPGAPVDRELAPEDAARVARFLERGVNSVPRKPFRPLRLLVILTLMVLGLSVFSQWLARWAGVY